MARNVDLRSSFRCAVAPEDGCAKIRINGRLLQCTVTNTSREGFGIQLSRRLHRKLTPKSKLELWYRNEKWEVSQVWDFHDNDKESSIGLNRVRELSKLKSPISWSLSLVPRFSSNTDPSFLLALVLAFMLTCMCLPGIGDNLGTASRIRTGVKSVMDYVTDTFN